MSSQAAAARTTGRRLLVVDDDPFYREIASATLEAEGYHIRTSSDGVEALERLSRVPLDLAVVDLTMPRMCGLELIAKVREDSLNRHVPIVVVTGSDDTETIEQAFAAGATSFVAKPINWPLFAQHVNYVYRAAQTEAELRHTMRTSQFLGELKDKLLTVLVSEFQAPLRIAHSVTDVLRRESHGPLGQPTYKECAEDLHKALQKITATQLKMMDAGRVLTHSLLIREEQVPLRDLVMETVEAVLDKADRRAIKIDTAVTLPGDPRMRCDCSLLGQAFRLILDGAIQFAPPKSRVKVEAYIEASGLVFQVTDRGPELSDAVIREILESPPGGLPDRTLSSLSRNAGLTISRALAEAHQGRLHLASDSADGNRTRLTMPLERIARPSAPASQRFGSAPDQVERRGTSRGAPATRALAGAN